MTIVERAIRRAKRAAGYDTRDLQSQIAARDPRWLTFCRAVEYINYEAVAGDIVEFGVFTGISLMLLARAQSYDPRGMGRRVAGFDSFRGLPGSACTMAARRLRVEPLVASAAEHRRSGVARCDAPVVRGVRISCADAARRVIYRNAAGSIPGGPFYGRARAL